MNYSEHWQYQQYKKFMEKYQRKELDKIDLDIDLSVPKNRPSVLLRMSKNKLKTGRSKYKWRYVSIPKFAFQRKRITKEQRARLRKERGNLCEDCKKLRSWHFHHINGIPSDNRDENLLLLCINCHKTRDKHMRLVRTANRYAKTF